MSDPIQSDEKPTVGDMVLFDSVTWTLFTIAAVTTVLRLLTRRFFLNSTGADDILAVAATLTLVVFVVTQREKIMYNNNYLQAVRDGEPIKSGPIVLHLLTMVDRMSLLVGLFYTITLGFTKVAILTFYRRIVVLKQHIYMVNITRSILILYTIAYVIAKCLAYSPVEAVWNPWDSKYGGKAKCFCELLAVVNSGFQVAFDVLILLIPFAIFRTLKLNKSMKIGICFIYVLGLVSFSMTVVRLHLALDRDASATFVELREKFTTFSIWTIIETTTALICANLPPMTTMLRRIYNIIRSSLGLTVASGSGSGSASGGAGKKGGNSYFRSLRHKSFGSGSRLPSKSGPFSLSLINGAQSPSGTAKSRGGKDQLMSVSSTPSIVTLGHRQGSSRALQNIGIKTETIIDIEKAESADVYVHEDSNDGNFSNDEGISKSDQRVLKNRASMNDYLPTSAERRGKVKTIVTGTELS